MKKFLIVLTVLVLLLTSACTRKTNSAIEGSEEIPDYQYSLDTMQYIPEFQCVDSQGNAVTNDIFSDNKVTLVNLWGTWCGPCVAEIPALQSVYDRMKDKGVGVIGVVEDAQGNEDMVQEILSENGVTYTNIYPDEKFYDSFVSLCFTFPSSLIVDSQGNVIMPLISGANDVEEFEEMLTEALSIVESGVEKAPGESQNNGSQETSKAPELEEYYTERGKNFEKDSVQYKNNLLMEELNNLSYTYCSDSYSATVVITKDGHPFSNSKMYVQDKNVRVETYREDTLEYLDVYNFASDVKYEYDAELNNLDTITKASHKRRVPEALWYGYCDFSNYNMLPATFTQTEMDGREVWLAEFVISGRVEDRTWIDAETGITIKNEYVSYDDAGNPVATYVTTVDVVPNQQFDPAIFEYDENHKIAEAA